MNRVITSSAYDRGDDDFNNGKPYSYPYSDDDYEDENYYGYDRKKEYDKGYRDAENDYWDDD